jgi:hypothetical protein
VRDCEPLPQVVLQLLQAEACQAHPVLLLHAWEPAGLAPLHKESPTVVLSLRTQVTVRVCVPVLHAVALQAEKAGVFHA